MISIADALMIMLGFGTFTVALIHLVVSIDKKSKKQPSLALENVMVI
ncbi:putative holin-like toxin [Staphylococcus pseudintermedius]|nr:putative holin-like toxin [Staphylococcus pseudintermedius]MDU0338079.1 putative holin-like toxin [Staphylococcus pseudintermedius]